MNTWAVIPAKSFGAAKTRLAPACSPPERADLARRLFLSTVRAARACDALAGVIVVSADPELRALATALDARAYADPPTPGARPGPEGPWQETAPKGARRPARVPAGPDFSRSAHCHALLSAGLVGVRGGEDSLNRAVELGCRRAAESGASAALVLPADLLLLTPNVIARFLRAAGDADVAVAPDRAEMGTNALLLRPPCALAPLFGPDSFARHRARAATQGLTVATVRLPELALDLDTPDDLALAQLWWRDEIGEEAVHA